MKWAILRLIRIYQLGISRYLPNACRFQPTCSVYMSEAVERYGALRGSWMGIRRLMRCRPGGGRGYDPVL